MEEDTKTTLKSFLFIFLCFSILISLFFITNYISTNNSLKKCLNDENHYIEDFGDSRKNCCHEKVIIVFGKYGKIDDCIMVRGNE